MLLRSSSTPVFGNLINQFSYDPPPSKDLEAIYKNITKRPPLPHRIRHNIARIHNNHHSTRIYVKELSDNNNNNNNNLRQNSLRRVNSDGNLVSLTAERPPMLHTEPSLSVYNDPNSDNGFGEMKDGKEVLERTVTIGEAIEESFSFGEKKKAMRLIEEEEGEIEVVGEALEGIQNLGFGEKLEMNNIGSPPLCLASGIGIGGVGLEDLSLPDLDEGTDNLEEYHQKMVEQCPFHPLFLRNYAQLLQSRGDLHGAEEYYSRASLADPEDGEIWMQYAKLVWELHHDRDRALSYFKLATEVAPQDCNVLAAYARFLWEIEDGEDEEEAYQDQLQVSQKESINEVGIHIAGGVSIDVPDSFADVSRKSENLEDYYRKIIKENPNNPLFLRNYAKFLLECNGDLQGAEEYYLRAVLADPGDGETTAEYAKLVWDRHHDSHKASIYFERAVGASPENCHVLAAYASFLWHIEDDEEVGLKQENQVPVPHFHKRAATAANV